MSAIVYDFPCLELWLFDVGTTTYGIRARDETRARLELSVMRPDLKESDIRNPRKAPRRVVARMA